MVSRALKRMSARLRQEHGFTMAAVMGAMMAIMGFSAAAIAVATNDLGGNTYNRETKQAVAAAEAGVNDYLYHLNQDNAYWTKCDNVEEPHAVNQIGEIDSPDDWRAVPSTNAEYAIELLPANGAPRCDDDEDAAATMIDTATGTFRIRVTGRVPTDASGQSFSERRLVVTLRRRNFLQFLYFTEYETSDPAWYALQSYGLPTRSPDGAPPGGSVDIVTWASANCTRHWNNGRGEQVYDGQRQWYDGEWYDFNRTCSQIRFAPGDKINGPFHTNDDLLVCGSPVFGRSSQDNIEVSGRTEGTPGWRASCSGTNPNFVGTFSNDAPNLLLPTTNSKLRQIVAPDYLFSGTTVIELDGENMRVTNTARGWVDQSMPLPPNGVVFVDDGVCGEGYDALDPYSSPDGCGDVYIEGTYSSDLTVTAEKDIVITDDVNQADDSVLGLIANQFVRVYHPVDNYEIFDCDNDGSGPFSIEIDAAILALEHSFTVDHYQCGNALGTLTVNGVIAQKYRGPVGTGNGSQITTGYLKDYRYDDRLALRQPPHFLDPVQSAWRIQRMSEQTGP